MICFCFDVEVLGSYRYTLRTLVGIGAVSGWVVTVS